jgi:hypothetical protein
LLDVLADTIQAVVVKLRTIDGVRDEPADAPLVDVSKRTVRRSMETATTSSGRRPTSTAGSSSGSTTSGAPGSRSYVAPTWT